MSEPDGDEVDRFHDQPVPAPDPEAPTEDALDQASDALHPNRVTEPDLDREAPEADALEQRQEIGAPEDEHPVSEA